MAQVLGLKQDAFFVPVVYLLPRFNDRLVSLRAARYSHRKIKKLTILKIENFHIATT